MTLTDRRSLTVTAANQAAARLFDEMVECFLAHAAATPDKLAQTFAADPDMTLAHSAKGFFLKLLGRRELDVDARSSLAAAQTTLTRRGGSERERRHVAALAAYVKGDPVTAVRHLESILTHEPLDVLAFKLSHALRFVLGDAAGMRRSTERLLPAWTEDVPDCGYVHGCHAFALEETGDYAAAEEVGRRAVDQAPRDAWGMHAVTHVMEMQDRPRDGVAWVIAQEPTWRDCNNFAFHVVWHRALFHLELNEADAALALYDSGIRAERTDDYRDIANGASLLWRLASRGIDVGDRWAELADLAERRSSDHALVFADGHYLLSLVGAGRSDAVERLTRSMGHSSRWRSTVQARIARQVGIALAGAMLALARREPGRAVDMLLPTHARLWRIGGSHAQRDVFTILLIDAAIAARRHELARSLLHDRLAHRPGNRWARQRLDAVAKDGRRGVRPAA